MSYKYYFKYEQISYFAIFNGRLPYGNLSWNYYNFLRPQPQPTVLFFTKILSLTASLISTPTLGKSSPTILQIFFNIAQVADMERVISGLGSIEIYLHIRTLGKKSISDPVLCG